MLFIIVFEPEHDKEPSGSIKI